MYKRCHPASVTPSHKTGPPVIGDIYVEVQRPRDGSKVTRVFFPTHDTRVDLNCHVSSRDGGSGTSRDVRSLVRIVSPLLRGLDPLGHMYDSSLDLDWWSVDGGGCWGGPRLHDVYTRVGGP